MSSDHGAVVTVPLSHLCLTLSFSFPTRSSPIQGAALMECFKVKCKARLRTLTLFFAVQLWATFFTSLSFSFFNYKLGVTIEPISQCDRENGMRKQGK